MGKKAASFSLEESECFTALKRAVSWIGSFFITQPPLTNPTNASLSLPVPKILYPSFHAVSEHMNTPPPLSVASLPWSLVYSLPVVTVCGARAQRDPRLQEPRTLICKYSHILLLSCSTHTHTSLSLSLSFSKSSLSLSYSL